MALTTIISGILLIAVGAVGYSKQDQVHASWTALIPAILGAVFLILGLLAFKDNLRKHVMHLAAALGVLGFLASLGRLIPKAVKGGLELNLASVCLSLMALICVVFVGLCVNSFIQARRRR